MAAPTRTTDGPKYQPERIEPGRKLPRRFVKGARTLSPADAAKLAAVARAGLN